MTVSEWLVNGLTCSNGGNGVVVYRQDGSEDQSVGRLSLQLNRRLNTQLSHVMAPHFAVRVLWKFKHRPHRRLSDDFAEPLVLQPLEGSSPEETGGTWPMPLAGPGQAIATPFGN